MKHPESIVLAAAKVANEGSFEDAIDILLQGVTKVSNRIMDVFRDEFASEDETLAVAALLFLGHSLEADLNEHEKALLKYLQDNTTLCAY
jgi:hypothetical protein